MKRTIRRALFSGCAAAAVCALSFGGSVAALAAPALVPGGHEPSSLTFFSDGWPSFSHGEPSTEQVVTGTALLVGDAPEGVADLFIQIEPELAIPVDTSSVSQTPSPGDTVEVTLDVPDEVLEAADVVGASEQEVAVALAESGELLTATELSVTSQAPVYQVAAAPAAHQLDVIMLTRNGRGKYLTESAYNAIMGPVTRFWVRESKGEISSFIHSYGSARSLTSSLQCTGDLWQMTVAGAQAFGHNPDFYMGAGARRHLIILSPGDETGSGCPMGYAGLGYVGGSKLASGGSLHVFADNSQTSYPADVVTHELGHNLGLRHAGTANCPVGVVDAHFGKGRTCDAGDGATAYGDRFNAMGSVFSRENSVLNGYQKALQGTISPGGALRHIDTNGTYDVTLKNVGLNQGSGYEALRLVETVGSSKREYYVEFDSRSGVQIRRGYRADDGTLPGTDPDTYMLSPGRTWTGGSGVWPVGETFVSWGGTARVRVDSISSMGAQVHVTMGQVSNATVSVNPTSWSPSATAQNRTVAATTNQSSWTATSNQTWLSVSPTSGSSGATPTVSVTANTSTSSRTATATFRAGTASATLTVTQAGVAAQCSSFANACTWDLSNRVISPVGETLVYLKFVAPSSGSYVFESTANGSNTDPEAWLYNSSQQRIAYDDDSGAGYNFKITVTLTAGQTYYLAAAHYYPSNSGQYTVTAQVPSTAPTVSVNPTSWSPTATAQNRTVTVTTNQSSWSASSNQTWLTVSPASGSSGATPTVTVTANTSTSSRSGTVTFQAGTASATVTVTQAAGGSTPVVNCGSTLATACAWDLSAAAISPVGTTTQLLKFTASSSGQYVLESSNRASSANPMGILYNSASALLAFDDDSAGNLNFRITVNLTAGQTYYLAVRQSAVGQSGQFTVTGRKN
ncbi:MAG: M43 family zinc metalloprotease [Micrococcales bacterium]|nr:M43 family zinc metalloprotease [Micrococcales bacterium]